LVTAQVQQVQSVYNFYIADVRLQRDIGQNDPQFYPNVPAERGNRGRRQGASPKAMLTNPTQPVSETTAKSASVASVAAASQDAVGRKP